MECRLCCRLNVPMSSGAITVGGVLRCFLRLATASALRCLGTETTGFSGTFFSFSLIKFGTIRRKATSWYKYMKRGCSAKFPIKTKIVNDRESISGTQDSSFSINAGWQYFISVVAFIFRQESVGSFLFE